jgi:hypothetical protein
MEQKENQKEINQAEWNNPDNWSVGFYFSKKDSRTWVPKSIRGWDGLSTSGAGRGLSG